MMGLNKYLQLTLSRHREGHRHFLRQIVEMGLLFVLRGHGPGFYHMAGFWRREIPWKDKWNHLNAREYRNKVSDLNPRTYHKISQHKVAEKGVLNLFDFPSAKFLGYIHPINGFDNQGNPLTNAADLTRKIEDWNLTRICFKEEEGHSGHGFRAINIVRQNDTYYFEDLNKLGVLLSIDDFCDNVLNTTTGGGAVIETYLEQHEWYTALNESSVNTLRLWVVQFDGEYPTTRLGYLRIGRAGSLIDNQSSGGIVAPIDLDTGIIRAAIDGRATHEKFAVHPDHGAQIEGGHLPLLAESMVLAERCLACFPYLRFAGLDIAVSKNGPVVVEMNVVPDREGGAFVDIPTRYVFDPKIELPSRTSRTPN